MLVANAWTVATSRALSRNARGIPTSYSNGNGNSNSNGNSKTNNARALFHARSTTTAARHRFSSGAIPQNVPTTRSCRLFSTTTIAEGDNDCSSTATPSATPNTNNNNNFKDWKESPLVNPTITFETLLVPNSQLTKWITHPGLQHKLAKPDNWEFLKHVHPRIKLVQDYDDDDDDDEGILNLDSKSNNSNSSADSTTNAHKGFKQLLLLPSSIAHATANHTATGMGMGVTSRGTDGEEKEEEDNNGWLSELLSLQGEDAIGGKALIRKGPSRLMSISHNQLSFQYILKQLLPESALPLPSSYEQIGHVAHFNLKEKHLPFKHLIGSALLESTSGDSIQTVVNKVGKVDGKFRTYECEILANVFRPRDNDNNHANASLETTVVEDGISIELNVAECYWCTRLSGERKELIRDIVKGRKRPPGPKQGQAVMAAAPILPPLIVADAFCGAGAVCMLLAKKIKDQDKAWKQEPNESKQLSQQQQQQHPSLTILANDWNPKAIEYMKRSIATNGMDKAQDESLHHKFELFNKDSYDFLSKLGEEQQTTKANPYVKKKRLRMKKQVKPKEPPKDKDTEQQQQQQEEQPSLMPDHVLMNFPLEAPQFLGALRWWSWKRLRDEGIKRTELYNDCYGGGKNAAANREWFPRFHVYTFARSSSPKADDDDEMAVNLVANELLPQPFVDDEEETALDGAESNQIVYRRDELNDECGTDFSTRIVRDVAPGKVVVCVSFSVTPKLIRYMQGDYF
jgi:tRNA G37 N-methylase Trm5